MIALVKGMIAEKREKSLTVMTSGGVGYAVNVRPAVSLNKSLGQEITLFTYSYIREDAFDLYGFESRSELNIFELLLSVSGIGPKTAMNVLLSGSPEDIVSAISKGDTAFFTATPGIGTKGAQRIIVDLQSKVGAMGELDLSAEQSSENKQVIEALRGFGFREYEAREALKSLPKGTKLSLEQKVKLALKSLSRK